MCVRPPGETVSVCACLLSSLGQTQNVKPERHRERMNFRPPPLNGKMSLEQISVTPSSRPPQGYWGHPHIYTIVKLKQKCTAETIV